MIKATSVPTPRLHPVAALKDQVVALDAAMLVAATSTEVGAVHKLRTTTRRVQAHLTLLSLLGPGNHSAPLPPFANEMETVLRRLRRVRQAAGTVRDLDVQISTIRLDAPLKAAVHKGTTGDKVRKQAKQLRKSLEARRQSESRALVGVLKHEEQKLAVELRALEQVLKPVKRRVLSIARLMEHVASHFASQTKFIQSDRLDKNGLRRRIESLSEEQLHALRKTAKQCRYMLENAPNGSDANAKAQKFEALQEAGGRWHDWHLLHQLAEDFHGRKAELTVRYETHAVAAGAEYHLRLSELLPALGGR